MIIYKITNNINGKVYIGQTTHNLNYRKTTYFSESNSGRPAKQRIISAFRKYGFNSFNFEILEECPKDKLNEKEIYWIKKYDSTNCKKGYNVLIGGKNVWLNEDIRKKIIVKQKMKKISEEAKNKISNTLQGHFVSEDTKKKQSISHKGKPGWNKGKKRTWFSPSEFKLGQKSCNKGKIAVNNGIKDFMILPNLLDEFLNKGYKLGLCKARNTKKGKTI